MRILFIRQNYPPERGPFRYIYNLATDLAAREHDITVITGLPHYPDGKPYKGFGKFKPVTRIENRVKVIRLPLLMASNRQPLRRIIGFFVFAVISFPVLLFCRKPDVLVCSIPPVTVAFPTRLTAAIRKIPLIMMLHDFEPLRSFELRNKCNKPFAQSMIRFFARIYGKARYVVVPIKDERQALIDYGLDKNKIMIIPHGIDLDVFDRLAGQEIPCKLPRSNGRKVAMYLGTVGMAHDVEAIVEEFADKEIRKLPIDFIIVGGGECLPVCEKIIQSNKLKNVRILPPVDIGWVPNILRQADILIMSQKPNPFSFGSKFCEYLASGKPLLVNSTGILAKTVQEIGNGWAFEARNNGRLKQLLQEYFSLSDTNLEEMGQKGLKFAKARLNSRDLHEVWEKLLQSTGSDR